MATYDGAAFLGEQIESIFAQQHGSLRLLVRDDGSTDATRAIVADYAARRPEMVVPVDPDGPHLGACGSFARLLEHSTADYVMLCDQDDVWLPGKVGAMLRPHDGTRRAIGPANAALGPRRLDRGRSIAANVA